MTLHHRIKHHLSTLGIMSIMIGIIFVLSVRNDVFGATYTGDQESNSYPQWLILIPKKGSPHSDYLLFDTIAHRQWNEQYSLKFWETLRETVEKGDISSQEKICKKLIFQVAKKPYNKQEYRIINQISNLPDSIISSLQRHYQKMGISSYQGEEWKKALTDTIQWWDGYDIFSCVVTAEHEQIGDSPREDSMIIAYHSAISDNVYLYKNDTWILDTKVKSSYLDQQLNRYDLLTNNAYCNKLFGDVVKDNHNNNTNDSWKQQSSFWTSLATTFRSWIGKTDVNLPSFVLIPVMYQDKTTSQYFATLGIPLPHSMYQCVATVHDQPYPTTAYGWYQTGNDTIAIDGNYDISIGDFTIFPSNSKWIIDISWPHININQIRQWDYFGIVLTITNRWPSAGYFSSLKTNLQEYGRSDQAKYISPIHQSLQCQYSNPSVVGRIWLQADEICTLAITYQINEPGIYNFAGWFQTNTDHTRRELESSNNTLLKKIKVLPTLN